MELQKPVIKMEFTVWMEYHWICQNLYGYITSTSVQLNQNMKWTSVNIKLQKYYLNMSFVCSTCLCELMARTHGFIYYTLKRTWCLRCFQPLNIWVHEHMNMISRTALRDTSWAFYCFFWENLSSYHITSRSSDQPVKINVWFNLKKLWQEIYCLI